jgi:hypothetical protein
VALPLIISVSVAYAVRRLLMREGIHTMKLIKRGDTVPEGVQAPFLATRTACGATARDFAIHNEGRTDTRRSTGVC